MSVLTTSFLITLPDLYTLNGHKMFPGKQSLDQALFEVKIWDFKKAFVQD